MTIESPAAGETIANSNGDVPVRLNVSLGNGEHLRLLLDGSAVLADAGASTSTLRNVDRGERTLEAQVVDERGSVVSSTEVKFVVFRASALFPSRASATNPN